MERNPAQTCKTKRQRRFRPTCIAAMYLLRVISDYPHGLVTEGLLKQIYPGSGAIKIGLPVDDVDADYLVVFRQLLLWPVDENGLIEGKDSYNPGVVSVTRLSRDDLPQAYVDLVHSSA